jgi:hypothetical protein
MDTTLPRHHSRVGKTALWLPADPIDKWAPSPAASREATKQTYEEQRALWRAHPKYRSTMAHHFVEEVHPMFRNGFGAVLRDLDAQDAQLTLASSNNTAATAPPEAVATTTTGEGKQPLGGPGKVAKVNLAMFRRVAAILNNHHRGEDHMFFPVIMRTIPETRAGFAWLSRDHEHLHPLEHKIETERDAAAFREFHSFLTDHLNREEMLIVPLLLDGRVDF